MAIILRKLDFSDYEIWSKMVFDYDCDLTQPRKNAAWEKIINLGKRSTNEVIGELIIMDGTPAGFVHYYPHDFVFSSGQTLYLSDLYVAPEFRRKGLARWVLNYLINFAKNNNFERLYWVTEHANPIRALYDELGIPQFVRYHIDF